MQRSDRLRVTRLLFALAACVAHVDFAARAAIADDEKPHAFEAAIQKFEEIDRQTPPPEKPILFVGSSTIRFWDVRKSFPDLPVMNRGFGGSHVADSVYFAERIVLKYKPKLIVFYAGDNDIASGKSPEQVLTDFQTLVAKVHAALPKTRLVFISIKPSIARWKRIDAIRQTNRLINDFVQSDPLLTFVDVEKSILGDDGKPRAELFIADGLHLNAKGYEIFASLVGPALKQAD
jgi:lysophospholipase L1-like esterase